MNRTVYTVITMECKGIVWLQRKWLVIIPHYWVLTLNTNFVIKFKGYLNNDNKPLIIT